MNHKQRNLQHPARCFAAATPTWYSVLPLMAGFFTAPDARGAKVAAVFVVNLLNSLLRLAEESSWGRGPAAADTGLRSHGVPTGSQLVPWRCLIT
jgi:hypothetical protein